MLRKTIITGLVGVCSTSAFAASLTLSPHSQKAAQTCTINVSAKNLVKARGFDIEVMFDQSIIACTSARFVQSALPGFSEFHQEINNGAGSFEVVLLKQTVGGYTGAADSFLVLTFERVSNGTAQVYIRKSYLDGNPLLIDESGASIEATVDTARVQPGFGPPPNPSISVTKLYPNYPNPFNPATTIQFDVSAPSPVYLKIFDVNGRLVRVLINGKDYENGAWEQKWDGKNDGGAQVQSGVYICVYEACGQRMSSKLVILR